MSKILKILLLIPVLYLFLIPVWLASSSNSGPCTGIIINIEDSSDYHFVTKNQLIDIVSSGNQRILGSPLKNISAGDIENRICLLKELRSAEVYLTIDGALHISADQRKPIMRIIPDEGGDYFVDEEGIVMRKRNLYSPRLHIVEGNINITRAMLEGTSVLDTTVKFSVMGDIYMFISYINGDPFWSAQIDQVVVHDRNSIDLIPRAGDQVIRLGSFENYKGKLKNLRAFYDQVLPVVGWDKYYEIDLQYNDQIVCKRRK